MTRAYRNEMLEFSRDFIFAGQNAGHYEYLLEHVEGLTKGEFRKNHRSRISYVLLELTDQLKISAKRMLDIGIR